MCKQCAPALGKVIEGFRKLRHQGSELKKRKRRYPTPKHRDREHYRVRKNLRRSLEDNDTGIDCVCKQCAPALGKVIEDFRKLRHQGSELKERKRRYPTPKHRDRGTLR